jgi:tetratricopeptide (TPR) repeat protein
MSFFRGLFDKKTPAQPQVQTPASQSEKPPARGPEMLEVFDKFGRKLLVSRQAWRDSVLIRNLEEVRNDPEQLYNRIVGALHDGFAADVIPYAEHFQHIDPVPSRGAIVLGVAYIETGRLDDAQRVFGDFIAEHGEEGVLLANLAKVHSLRGDEVRAKSILWHALELDPNQDMGFGWYAAMERERGGESAGVEAYRRIAALPQSWRARIWLARDALQRKDLAAAEALYTEALAMAPRPVPTDFLKLMSGDLGIAGYLTEVVRLAEPHFDPAFHGLLVGNNLIKANLDLGRLEQAKRVLDLLYAQKRPDWREGLSFWDTELAKAGIAAKAKPEQEPLTYAILSIEGPIWMRNGSPFSKLLPAKRTEAPCIAILGSTALFSKSPERPTEQLADAPGRITRIVPLVLAESIHLTTDAVGVALIPWAQGHGFALFGQPYEDTALCEVAAKDEIPPAFIVGVTLDATQPKWKLLLRVLRQANGQRLAETTVDATIENPAAAIDRLSDALVQMLATHAGVKATQAPPWYRRLTGLEGSDYLLRLEQQLAILTSNPDFLKGGTLSGEREILDGIIQLCVRQPDNRTARMVMVQTMRLMKKARPDILPEYKNKIDALQHDYPVRGDLAPLVEMALAEVFAV